MQSFTAGQANTVYADVLAKADGEPIISGTVNFYLLALSGDDAGKWFRTSDDSWQAFESIAAVGTHKADGHWTASIDSAAWVTEVRYMLYAKESGNLHIAYSEEIVEITTPKEVSFEATVTD
jgi:hypothetical protein